MKISNRPSKAITACLSLALLGGAQLLSAQSDTIKVARMLRSEPVTVTPPAMLTPTDVNGQPYSLSSLLDLNTMTPLKATLACEYGDSLPYPAAEANPLLSGLEFVIDATSYIPDLRFIVPAGNKIKVDAMPLNGNSVALRPGSHTVNISLLAESSSRPAAEVSVAVDSIHASKIAFRLPDQKRLPSLNDFADGTNFYKSELSPDGSMLLTGYSFTLPGGQTEWYTTVTRTDGSNTRIGTERRDNPSWMPTSNLLYVIRQGESGRQLVTLNPVDGTEKVICKRLPDGQLTIAPDETFAIVSKVDQGPMEGDVYQILEPEDRQPGWRNRVQLLKVDFATGVVEPITFGSARLSLNDISADSRKLLISISKSRLEKRPTTITTLVNLDLKTMKLDTVAGPDGFISYGQFSPDGKKVAVKGTPESFNGIGLDLPEGRTASMIEGELFIVDLATKAVSPVTANFNPSVNSFKWSLADNMIYLTAEDYDLVSLFRLDPATGKIGAVKQPEQYVSSFSLPNQGYKLALFGQSDSNYPRLYLVDLKNQRSTLVADPNAAMLAKLDLGECIDWNYVTERGDTVYARYYTPVDFDPSRKYPLIVNYYGGCSPTSRTFSSHYPHHLYAAQGYGVLVINPSGATGRGQEWASRHVNTAGHGPAEDIIEGTKQFCEQHPWIDASKIGCIGASYGGFMTQYLQTITDIFAAAISHAGISDHTSYWGEGYWGYSYSEVSMANSYPWSETDLYVKQSPLYNADKIHTPLLFLHGDSDNNVPVGESIQMFTALKLLGRETAFVAVADQDHHILDYNKRIKWQDTIFAWFEKYLKGDDSWWNAMYPPKSL